MTAAARAMTEPTERSIPPVPMTIAMPRATMSVGAVWMSWSRRLLVVTKWGVMTMFTTTRATSAR